MSGILELDGVVQQYAWGKPGSSSTVAKLAASGNQQMSINEDQPYAELWMGAHVKAPSVIKHSGEKLNAFISSNANVLGNSVTSKFQELPYLFKVLSVAKSLSIQAHPNKTHAEELHAKYPDIYKDPNHKPEMAIALTPFEALCGFRPLAEIVAFTERVPELAQIIGDDTVSKLKSELEQASTSRVSDALKESFTKVIFCDKKTRENLLLQLTERARSMNSKDEILGDLLLRIDSQFPGDVGCFVIYFLNHMSLQPGQALFLGANVPHAYLLGDCIECMACSDNVVRAGCTPKLIDKDTLCGMLLYQPSSALQQMFQPEVSSHPCEMVYNPPVDDFAVLKTTIPSNTTEYEFSQHDSASIVLFVEGSCRSTSSDIALKAGSILFVPANSSLKVALQGDDTVVAYRALCLF